MSWRDRDYNQSEYGGHRVLSRTWAILNGSVPAGTWFGIPVRIHATLLLFIGLTLLFCPEGMTYRDAATSMGVLFAIVLLHEFGHCIAARSVGGQTHQIILWILGGIAYNDVPRRPWPRFVTVMGGPLTNALICLITAALIIALTPAGPHPWAIPLNPLHPVWPAIGASTGLYAAWWVFYISYLLLLFNLLPIYPLDGGKIVQTLLWPKYGYFKSMYFSCAIGMIGAVGLAIFGTIYFNLLILLIAAWGFFDCYVQRQELKHAGPDGLFEAFDFSESLESPRPPKAHHLSRRAIKKARKLVALEHAEQEQIDAILAKVSARGMHSLNWRERRTLHKATARQRQRDLELSR